MRVSYRWLRELVSNLDRTPAEVAERLTAGGLAVDGVVDFGAASERVVIAKVTLVEPHPSRERLRLVTVDAGTGKPSERIVCGAPNVPEPGGLVVLAPVGTHLPALGLTIEPRPIGGVPSAGMLVSEEELGLSESSEGILVFPPGTAAPGARLTDVVPETHDTIFDLAITPNRPDALGHVGVARDVAALFGLPFAPPVAKPVATMAKLALNQLVTVSIEEPERCPMYGAAMVDDVKIGPSPLGVRFRLQALGVRSISNVVDVTNWILLEFGYPMHAFDYSLVRGQKLVVRSAKSSEPFKTLDGVERKLDRDDLVIADGEGPAALAGVMGGENSEIRASTRRVLLECAYFRPEGIRRTSRRHGLSTESSYRFERGVDWGSVPLILERSKALLAEFAGGLPVPGAIVAAGAPLERRKVTVRSRRLDALLGSSVPFDDAASILGRLGFAVSPAADSDGPALEAEVPSFRPDISREVDLIEEVARVRGFDRIPTVLPAIAPEAPRQAQKIERNAAREASNLGLSEAITYSFVSERDLAALGAEPPVVILKNPQNDERTVMRTSLLPGLLDALRRARRRGEREVRLFTVGMRFLPPAAGASERFAGRDEDVGVLPEERPSFAAVLAGPRPGYLASKDEVDVFDAKGVVVEFVSRLTGRPPDVALMTAAERPRYFHPRGAATIELGGKRIGSFGPIHPEVVAAFDLEGSAQIIEMDLIGLESLGHPIHQFRAIPRLPAIERDVALVVPDAVASAEVEREIVTAAGPLCESVALFDVWSGESVGEGRRSLAYHVVYRDPKSTTDPDAARTLTDAEVDKQHERVRAAVKKLGELRG